MNDADTSDQIEELFSAFRSADGAKRQHARMQLVMLGEPVLPFLVQHLTDRNDLVRWEIAKTLEEIRNPSAAPAMVKLLTDDISGIRWLAAEGLVNLRLDGLVPLLKGLQTNFQSTFFREGAHHVLRELEHEGLLNGKTLDILNALEGPAPALSVPFAAVAALRTLEVDDGDHA